MPEPIFVFKVNQVGDAICFLPVLQQLAASGGADPIHLWTTPSAEPILNCSTKLKIHQLSLREFNGAWKKPALCWRILNLVRNAYPHACLLDWDQGNVAHLAALLSRARHVVGGTNGEVKLNRFLPSRPSSDPRHTIPQICWDIGRRFASEALNQNWQPNPPQPDLSHLIHHSGEVVTSLRPILIHPGASHGSKRWPLERFIELAARLVEHHPVQIIQPRELPPFQAPAGVELITPSSLADLATFVSQSSLLIGNNSGPMNFAYALGIPTVIFWGTAEWSWRPQWNTARHLALTSRGPHSFDQSLTEDPVDSQPPAIHSLLRWQVSEVLELSLRWHSRQQGQSGC